MSERHIERLAQLQRVLGIHALNATPAAPPSPVQPPDDQRCPTCGRGGAERCSERYPGKPTVRCEHQPGHVSYHVGHEGPYAHIWQSEQDLANRSEDPDFRVRATPDPDCLNDAVWPGEDE